MGNGECHYGFDGEIMRYSCPCLLYSSRRIRRTAHEALTKSVVRHYHPIQTKEATILVSSLLTPSVSNPDKQFQCSAASTILSIVYDHPTILSEHDQTLQKIEAYNLRVSKAATPGTFFVDIFPWMMHIPERFWLICCDLILYTDA